MAYELMDGIEAEPDEWHELLIEFLGPKELDGFVPDFMCVGEKSPFVQQGGHHVPEAESIRRSPAMTHMFANEKDIQLARCHYCHRLIGRELGRPTNPWACAMFYIEEMP